MAETPLVSVLMTVYNREKYIAEAIESVLASSYTNFELIIVDDLSKDNSMAIARSYEAKDPRIKVYVNEQNLGDYPNRNKAASYAKGKYLKYLDSDDLIYRHGLDAMVRAMEQFPDANIGIADINYNGLNPFPYSISSHNAYYEHFFGKGLLYVGPSAAIYRSDYFFRSGSFKPFGVASDYEFNLAAASESEIVLLPRDLIYWRRHDAQEYQKHYKKYLILNYLIHKQIIPKSPLSTHERNILTQNLDKILVRKIIRLLIKFKCKDAIQIYRESQIRTSKFLYVFSSAKKPSEN